MILIQRALLVAVQAGSKRVVNLLLDHGAQTIFPYPGYINNIPPLYLAAQNGHEDLVDLLCERGYSCYDDDMCPLLWAIEHNHRGMVRTLLRPQRHILCNHCWYAADGHEPRRHGHGALPAGKRAPWNALCA